MRPVLVLAMLALSCARADAGILYQQPPDPSGVSYMSAWWDPDGSNYDRYVWDAFTLDQTADIHSIEWRGTHGPSGPVTSFTVAIYGSIAAGTQPDFSRPPLVEYQTGDDAGQTYAGDFGGVPMYDHHFTLPAAFPAQVGIRYWLQIEGWQPGFPDWSIAAGQGGNGTHFLCEHNNLVVDNGVPTGCWFTTRTGDAAFTLLSAATGVEDGTPRAELALRGVFPNPSRGERLEVEFSLPSASPAQLALFDVCGRAVRSEEVGSLGAGLHVIDLARWAPIEPGIYFIQLTRGEQEVVTRAVVVR